jgi:hypothetical protein
VLEHHRRNREATGTEASDVGTDTESVRSSVSHASASSLGWGDRASHAGSVYGGASSTGTRDERMSKESLAASESGASTDTPPEGGSRASTPGVTS